MTPKTFYSQLAIVSASVALILFILNSFELFASHQVFSWVSLLGFIIFCSLLYFVESKTVHAQDKSLFGKLFLMSIFFKMLFCVLLIIVYIVSSKPDDRYFILPFFIIYLFFTVYEVYFVSKLAKS
jgi:hypothetical protein